jgi:HAD superfamily hydrolase (TIGR01549 family)
MPRYRAILFDLFGTVALLPEKIPLLEWNGQTTRLATAAVRGSYEEEVRDIPFDHFFAALMNDARERAEERSRDLREIPCHQRFARTLRRAGLPDSASTRRLAEKLALAYNAAFARVPQIPAEHVSFLARTAAKYRLALVSNFDHGPTARQLLEAGMISQYFLHIAVSDEHGWCKPDFRIFADTLAALRVHPSEVLFVGDSPQDDVAGAKQMGMDVAWVNPHNAVLPEGIPKPDYTVPAIPSLDPFLFDNSHPH